MTPRTNTTGVSILTKLAVNLNKIWPLFFSAALVQASAAGATNMLPQIAAATSAPSPAPQVIAPKSNDHLLVTIPPNIQLATPFDLKVVVSGAGLAVLTVYQKDELGHHYAAGQVIDITHIAGNTASGKVTPMLLGSVTFTVEGVFKDGDVEKEDVTVPVSIPSIAPKVFHGEDSPSGGISLTLGGNVDGAALQPIAYYGTIPDEIDDWGHAHPVAVHLDGRVQYSIIPSNGAPVVRLQQDPHEPSDVDVVALNPGTATLEARFGSAVDYIKVSVERPQNIK